MQQLDKLRIAIRRLYLGRNRLEALGIDERRKLRIRLWCEPDQLEPGDQIAEHLDHGRSVDLPLVPMLGIGASRFEKVSRRFRAFCQNLVEKIGDNLGKLFSDKLRAVRMALQRGVDFLPEALPAFGGRAVHRSSVEILIEATRIETPNLHVVYLPVQRGIRGFCRSRY